LNVLLVGEAGGDLAALPRQFPQVKNVIGIVRRADPDQRGGFVLSLGSLGGHTGLPVCGSTLARTGAPVLGSDAVPTASAMQRSADISGRLSQGFEDGVEGAGL